MAFVNEKEEARRLRKSNWWRAIVAKGQCHYCQQQFPSHQMTMDHLVPLAQGGRSIRGNIVGACKDCNTAKRDRTPVEWILANSTQSP